CAGGPANEGLSGTSDIACTITLANATIDPGQVRYAPASGTATQGTDYLAASGTVTFATGETSKTVIVKVIGETKLEPDEQFTFTLSSPGNGTLGTATATGRSEERRVGEGVRSRWRDWEH